MRLNNTVGVALVSALSFSSVEAAMHGGSAVRSSTVTVTTTAEFMTAVNAAVGNCGVVIGMAPGDYSGINTTNPDIDNKNFSAACPLVITSKDPNNYARLHDFNIGGESWVVWENLEFVANDGGTSSWAFDRFQHVTFNHVYVHAQTMDNNPDSKKGTGFKFFDADYTTVMNSTLRELNPTAVSFSTRDGLSHLGQRNQILNNRCLIMAWDCFDGAQQFNMSVIGNIGYNWHLETGAHSDFIQFSTSNTDVPSDQSFISDNLVCRGSGDEGQSIFGGDDSVGFNRKMTNATIQQNTVVGMGLNAIRQDDQLNITVSDNRLYTLSGGGNSNYVLTTVNGVKSTNNTAIAISIFGGGNTNVTSVGDTLNFAVSDKGAAAVALWQTTHPGRPPCFVLP